MKINYIGTGLLAASLMAFSAPSHAVGTLWFSSTGSPVWTLLATDQGAGDAAAGTVGATTFVGSFGNWSFVLNSGASYPILGTPNALHMDFAGQVTSSNANEVGTFLFIDDGFTLAQNTSTTAKFGGTAGGTISYNIFYNSANLNDANSGFWPSCTSGGPFGPGAFATTNNSCVLPADLDGFSTALYVTVQGGRVSSWDLEFQVPEPGTLALLGLGLLGIGVTARRKAV